MAAIADAADVAIETIYLSVGNKPAIVRDLIETALSGTDEPVAPAEREGVRGIHAEPDPRRKIELFAAMVRPMLERLAPLWEVAADASPDDHDLQEMVTELRQRHVGSMRLFVENLGASGSLRSGLTHEAARDILWAMNSVEFYHLLVVERKWSGEMFEAWLADAWQRLLLAED